MACLLYCKADTMTDRTGYNDSRIDLAESIMTTYIDTEDYVYHIELDSYGPTQGNLLFSDGSSLKTTDGQTTRTVAGNARINGNTDGAYDAARFYYITGFTQISSRDVIVADSFNHCLRIIDRLTLQTLTSAGDCGTGGFSDGQSRNRFNYPHSIIANNKEKDTLLVTDSRNWAVRHVDLTTWNVSTFFRDTRLNDLRGITQDTRSGDLYLTSSSAVYQLTYQDRILALLVGHQTLSGYQDGTFTDTRFHDLYELLLIDNNKILVADEPNNRLRVLDRVSNTTESICTGIEGYTDGDVNSCSLDNPSSLLVSGDSVYIGESQRIRKLSEVRVTTTQSTTTTSTTTASITTTSTTITSTTTSSTTTTSTVTTLPSLSTTTTASPTPARYEASVITPCEATYYRKSSRVCEHCDCTSLSQSDQCDNTGQCPCETSDSEKQELAGRRCNWYIEKVFPLYGPVAGGTKVSITGGYFSQGQIKATLDGVPLNLTISGNSASFISEPYPENKTTHQDLKVSLIVQNRTVGHKDFDFGFEYRPNPILEGIQSRKTFLNGGFSLNVTGQHMDSVAFPTMIVYIRQYGKIVSTATSVCHVTDNTMMACPTPDVKNATDTVLNNQTNIQEDSDGFTNLTEVYNSTRGILDSGRVKRSAGKYMWRSIYTISVIREIANCKNNFSDPGEREPLNGKNGLGYTLGFRYDGYKNDTDLKTHRNPKFREISVLKVFDDPKIYGFVETEDVDDDVLEFDPKKDKNIRIEGTGLDWDPDQWVVEIGRERYRVISVFTNRIICEPPLKMPQIDAAVDYREHKGKQIPHIVVRIGNIRPTIIGFVYYKSSLWEDSVAFRVSVIVLPIIAIIAFIVILLCHLRRKRNKDTAVNKCNQPLDESMNLKPVGVDTFFGRKLDENLVATLRRCRIPKSSLTLEKNIGKGNFGTVYKARQSTASGSIRTVAAKTLNENKEMTADDLETFLTEGMLMVDFDHVNVMSLVGVVFEDGDWPLVVLPYMENGDLRTLIKRDDIELRMGDLLHFAHQIANGMDYLSKERFVHRDLAARNCMVDGTYVVKVADFGMSRDIYEKDYYATGSSDKPLPVRWMAPECLLEGRYSTKSDVWSYGITMWELITRGGLPYPGVDNYHIKDYVVAGNRLSKPESCPPIICEIMSRCWDRLPDDRPEFSEISLSLKEIFYGQASSAKDDGYDYTRCVTKSIEHDYTVSKPETEGGVIDDTRLARNNDYIDNPTEALM